MRQLLLFLYLLIGITPFSAQSGNYNQITELYTTEHGLSSTKISCITQDSKGFIWIGTEDGLNKFDGYQFTIYKRELNNSYSLISDQITALFSDSRNRLWVATIEGLQYYDPETDGFVRASLNQPDYVIKNSQCVAILEDRDRNLWFAISGQGVLHYMPETNTSTLYTPSHTNPNNSLCEAYIRSIAEDKDGNIWFGSQSNGISVYSPTQKHFTNFNTGNSSLPANTVFSIEQLNNGNMMLSTIGGGIAIYNFEKEDFITYPDLFNSIIARYLYCAFEDKYGNILLGTEGNGLMVFDPKQQTIKQHPVFREHMQTIGDTKVHSIFEDKNGFIWIGMNYQGLCMIKNNPVGFKSYRKISNESNSLSFGHVTGITTDQNNEVWIATDGGGLNHYNPKTDRYTHYRYQSDDPFSISDDAVVTVFCDSKNRIWVGTYTGGLCLFDRNSRSFTRYPVTNDSKGLSSRFIKSIIEDHKGNLWIGTNGGGLNHFDTEKGVFRSFRQNSQQGLISDYITRLFIDSKGVLWIASHFGLSCMDLNTENFTSFGPEQGFSRISVYSIAEDPNGSLWVGTQGGLNKYIPEENRFILFTPHGIGYSPVINGIIPYKNQLWLSTNNGILNYNPGSGQAKKYTMQDGLQSDEFILSSYYISPEGEMFFGGINGFNSFFPDEIIQETITPRVYITNLRIFSQSVPINKEINGRIILSRNISETHQIKLRHSDKSFTLEFTAPDTPEPTSTFYAGKLVGFSQDWEMYDYTRRYATFTNLNPGTYTFQIMASNNPDDWGNTITSLTIVIEPPIWATWWARLGYFIIAGIILYSILRGIYTRIHERNELRIERMKVKQQEELSQEKMQFFTNISHEFRTPLTLIMGPLEHLLSVETDPEKKQTEQMMHRNAERLLRMINQILELRKVEDGKMKLKVQLLDLISFVSSVLGDFSELGERKGISLTYSWQPDEIVVWYDPDMLDKCLYNLLSNAFKFTTEGGKIQVDLQQDENGFVFLRISDTGIGMPQDVAEHIFERFYQGSKSSTTGTGVGLHLTQSIIELHGGDITVESREGDGTTFCITILPGNKHFSASEIVNLPYQSAISETSKTKQEEDQIGSETNENLEEKLSIPKTTILLVEDDDDMRRYIYGELQDEYNIIEATNGKSGLAKAQKLIPDLVITDVMMPKMNGIELCRTLKTSPDTSHIPVIILTALGDMDHQIEGLETGADSYISKPFQTKHLRVRIEKLIELRRTLKERFSKSINMDAQEMQLTSTDERLLQKVIDYIRKNLENPELSVESMSKELGISRTHLHRKLKALTGQSPVEFIKVIRMKQAAYLLNTGKLSISEVGYRVGYSTPSYFSSSFNAHFGMSPSAYMEKQNTPNSSPQED